MLHSNFRLHLLHRQTMPANRIIDPKAQRLGALRTPRPLPKDKSAGGRALPPSTPPRASSPNPPPSPPCLSSASPHHPSPPPHSPSPSPRAPPRAQQPAASTSRAPAPILPPQLTNRNNRVQREGQEAPRASRFFLLRPRTMVRTAANPTTSLLTQQQAACQVPKVVTQIAALQASKAPKNQTKKPAKMDPKKRAAAEMAEEEEAATEVEPAGPEPLAKRQKRPVLEGLDPVVTAAQLPSGGTIDIGSRDPPVAGSSKHSGAISPSDAVGTRIQT
ncbi:hypothetical protein FRC12_009556 [Ceratobasidium sp. 428]|nr:hypothetical protein FRC12_009556 [Ceratobasidium sp. 428]